jgi:hypothetical protein
VAVLVVQLISLQLLEQIQVQVVVVVVLVINQHLVLVLLAVMAVLEELYFT